MSSFGKWTLIDVRVLYIRQNWIWVNTKFYSLVPLEQNRTELRSSTEFQMKKSPALFERDIRKLYSTPMEIYFDLANEWVSINETKKFQFLMTTLTPCK